MLDRFDRGDVVAGVRRRVISNAMRTCQRYADGDAVPRAFSWIASRPMSILGTRVARIEDPRFLTDGGTYMADFKDPLLDGAAYITFVRSTLAHGTFTVDVSEAATA